MSKSNQNLNTAIRITYKNGDVHDYTSIEECSEKTKISQAALKIRCNKSGKMADGTLYEWIDSHTKKSYQAKKSRNKGSAWEADIIHHLRDMGYTECISARGESKFTDNNKVDIIDRSGKLPINIQAKHTANTPAYFKIENSCPYKDKSFVLCWKKAPTEGSVSPGAIAMIPMDFFYTLLECYSKSNNLI